jgi:polysaccharide biosynthesis protein PslG
MIFLEQFTKATKKWVTTATFRRRWLPAIIGTITAGALVLAVSVTAAPSHSASQVGIAEPDLIGESAAVQASNLAGMKAIGITSIRLDANWDWVQYGGATTFDWGQLDQVVESVRAAGMSVDLIIDGCPPWAAKAGTSGNDSPQPASAAKYATWAAKVAARYGPMGVGSFEIWNEPNNVDFWQPGANAAAYTADLVAAYAAIKKADPAAFVVSGGLAPETTGGGSINAVTFLKEMYADGAKGSFDAVGYHPYSYPALPNTYESWSGWSQMSQTNPSIRSVMTSNGDSAKQVWITEFGAPTSGPWNVGTANQRLMLSQAITYAKEEKWIDALYIYTWQDTPTGPSISNGFGLLTSGGSRKLAYAAVSQFDR